MKDYINKRVITLAEYILENKATVRSAAKNFGISKSTVHKDVSERLKKLDSPLYEELKKLKELLDLGIVTEEEFETKKKQLLDL